jgi:hypothetical protein
MAIGRVQDPLLSVGRRPMNQERDREQREQNLDHDPSSIA